ncbi:hypothetical protein KR009_010774, partial [Drosophila setifemur]
IFILLPVIRADLMCYVCDDCAQLPKDAPLLACNEDFFNPGGSTEASTVTTTTTTEASTTSTLETTTTTPMDTTTVESSSAETSPATTEVVTSTTTVETTTIEQTTDTTQSTEAPPPTPPTAGPVQTTAGVPTPPAEDLEALAVALNSTRLLAVNPESSTPSLAIRQRRAVIETDVTYHCYSVQVSVNGSMTTDRGCSRVSTFQGVCELLKMENSNTELANCNPCSMDACNGSATLQNSIVVSLILALVAFALQRN